MIVDMSILLIVLGCAVVYLLVGVFYARSQYVRLWQLRYAKRDKECSSDLSRKFATEDAKMMCAWRIPCWPYAIVYDIVSQPFGRWFMQPFTARQAYAEQLRADAKSWDEKRHTGTDTEREMATELARICRERAEEVQP